MTFFSTNETKPRPKDPRVVRVVKTTNGLKPKEFAFEMNPGKYARVDKRITNRSAGPLKTTDLRAIAERKKAAAAIEQKRAASAAKAISAPAPQEAAKEAPQAKRPGRPRKTAR